MTTPKILDLYCGAGGCSVGYARAGFEVTGVDIDPHPDYPYEFVQADALEVLADATYLARFDVIHASPPCKAFTKNQWSRTMGYNDNHPDLLTPTREALERWGGPYVIENVPGAPMRADLLLCGSQFGLNLRRHRLFETNPPLFTLLPPCWHQAGVASPFGHPHYTGEADEWAQAMQIDWMKAEDLAQAIPPAYTQYIGEQLLAAVNK